MSQNDPQWGGRRKDGPPDLDEMIRNLTGKLSRFFGGGNGQGPRPQLSGRGGMTGIGAIVAVLLVLWGASGFYVVDEREDAVIMRFGRYVETVENSGLHWHLPWPVESRELVNVTEIRSLDVGARAEGKSADEAVMLTGDQNIIDVQLEVQYTLKSAKDFVFNNRRSDKDGKDLVKQAAETAIREVVGKNKVDYVLNEGRGKIGEDTKELMQDLLNRYATGIAIARVNISDVQPPEQVQAAFADAVKARQDKARLINEGTAYANDVIPKASGMAARLVQEAEGYKQQVVARAEGDASRFTQVATEYAKAPQVTRDRMYLDAMQQMYQNTTKVLVDQKSGSNLLYLPLDKLMQMSSSSAPAATGEAAKPVAEAAPAPAPAPRANDRGERYGR
ncbi:FtsH protease activity modulator HflK [Jeongeupia naejangsanensis]|uniref:Protein HflK n=1 Tax=Jeongeupia naejangsanensis TaxID=613195 RepID=A0ABS2BGV3_9NEIS|nr:FtsH protease activity modulator HflK [Jeongeupia naejangsanensis]MBM3114836.1 FtsH protease activity modulator HflK [Jeongeupia naejangsanensis]